MLVSPVVRPVVDDNRIHTVQRRPDLSGERMPTHARKPLVSLVVPFHDEDETIDAFFAETLPVLESVDAVRVEIVCINDGSRDRTLDRLLAFSVVRTLLLGNPVPATPAAAGHGTRKISVK